MVQSVMRYVKQCMIAGALIGMALWKSADGQVTQSVGSELEAQAATLLTPGSESVTFAQIFSWADDSPHGDRKLNLAEFNTRLLGRSDQELKKLFISHRISSATTLEQTLGGLSPGAFLFYRLDLDKSGALSLGELRKCDALGQRFDGQGFGQSFKALCQMILPATSGSGTASHFGGNITQESQAQTALSNHFTMADRFDPSRDGEIDLEQFKTRLIGRGDDDLARLLLDYKIVSTNNLVQMSGSQGARDFLFHRLDLDKSGALSLDEFLKCDGLGQGFGQDLEGILGPSETLTVLSEEINSPPPPLPPSLPLDAFGDLGGSQVRPEAVGVPDTNTVALLVDTKGVAQVGRTQGGNGAAIDVAGMNTMALNVGSPTPAPTPTPVNVGSSTPTPTTVAAGGQTGTGIPGEGATPAVVPVGSPTPVVGGGLVPSSGQPGAGSSNPASVQPAVPNPVIPVGGPAPSPAPTTAVSGSQTGAGIPGEGATPAVVPVGAPTPVVGGGLVPSSGQLGVGSPNPVSVQPPVLNPTSGAGSGNVATITAPITPVTPGAVNTTSTLPQLDPGLDVGVNNFYNQFSANLPPGPLPQAAQTWLAGVDGDKNGLISSQELDHLFNKHDANQDGKIDAAEAKVLHPAEFGVYDVEKDGGLSKQEVGILYKHYR